MRPLSKHHFFLHELNIEKQTSGKKPWHNHFNSPKIGIGILYSDLINHSLGKALAIYPYVDFPLIKDKDWLSFKSGIGLGYLTEKHHIDFNHENIAIGSHLNAAITLQLQFKYRISHFQISSGPAFTHFSNGTVTMPNLGINLLHWKLGVTYSPNDAPIDHKESPIEQSSWIRTSVSWGVREIAPPGSKKYHALSITNQFQKFWSSKIDYIYGADLFYNSSINGRYDDEIPDVSSNLNNLQIGVSGGIALKLDPVQFTLQMGAYLWDKHRLDGTFYHRYGFYFMFSENLGINLTLKTHFAKADHVETGIIYRIKK